MEEIYLSIIIPAYNEQNRIKKTLREIDDYLKKKNFSYEILVVNDGSRDQTLNILNEMKNEIKNLKILSYEKNRGKGFAVKYGMENSQGKIRVFTDADHSTSIDHLEKMLPEFEKGYDLVVGTRDKKDHPLARQVFSQPKWRIFLGDIFNLLVQFILGLWGFWDTQCGFKGFTQRAVSLIFSKCKIEKFAFDPEILILAKKQGLKIQKIPVLWKNDPESKVKLKSVFNMLKDIFRIRIYLFLGKYG
ncbi:MAG: dolichyl-phosphate beta-glucosyltransferase [Minisyncoccales bacterium]